MKTKPLRKPTKSSKFNPKHAEDALYIARGDYSEQNRAEEGVIEEVFKRAKLYYEFLNGTHPVFNAGTAKK